ncbi:MAG: LCP family protein [Candidatus Margulisbacteria bacterium]|nr:LCP family protein [Candidatus Margulisiibacteriota bacterium]
MDKKKNWESEYLKSLTVKKVEKPKGGRRGFPWLLAFAMFIMIIFAVFLGFGFSIFSRFILLESLVTMMPGEQLFPETNVLILGLDSGRLSHRSDTIMVVHINPDDLTADIVSIPRDTLVSIPRRGQDKINHAYAYGGLAMARETVEDFLGLKIPYYVVFDMSGLASLIDEIGGVKIEVEGRMYYMDYSQDLRVDLKPGTQVLNGRNTLAYLRYRSDGGDLKRIQRQQKFIKALADQMSKRENMFKAPNLVMKLLSHMQTNLNTREIFGLAFGLKKISELGSIKMTSLQGNDSMIDGVYYMLPNKDQINELVKTKLMVKEKSLTE